MNFIYHYKFWWINFLTNFYPRWHRSSVWQRHLNWLTGYGVIFSHVSINCTDWLIDDWVVVLRLTRHKINHFGNVPQANLLVWCEKTKPNITKADIHHHTQQSYGPFSGTIRVSRCQKRREDNKRQTHRQSGWAQLHPTNQQSTSINPPTSRWMSFLPQPPQFIPAWAVCTCSNQEER